MLKSRLWSGAVVALVIGMAGASTFAHDGKTGHDAMSGEMMATIDANHDGSISAAEHAAYAQHMFEKMDANHDGSVSQAELEAGMQAMHAMHEKGGMAGHAAHDAAAHDAGAAPTPDTTPGK